MPPPSASPLARGAAGISLFFAYGHLAFPDRGWDDLCLSWLEEALEAVAATQLSPSLYSGFSGAGWVLRHLEGRILEESEEDPGAEVEEALLSILSQPVRGWSAELIAGLAGHGVYFLERLPGEGARRGVEAVIDRLAAEAEAAEPGVTWFTPAAEVPPLLKDQAPSGYYNLGVSHGVPGAVGFLAAAVRHGIAVDKARPLLAGALDWLLAQRLPDRSGPWFASFVGPGVDPSPARLAWCYGDPGVAAVLLAAARALGRRDLDEEALACARRAARPRDEETSIIEPGLCHGAAGLGQIFNRLAQKTGDPSAREAALYWLGRTLEMRKPGTGAGGFQSGDFDANRQITWVDDPGFLTGSAGIGLALLAAIDTTEPAWDRVLLLS